MGFQALLQLFKKKIMPIFFCALAFYTLYSLIASAIEVSRKTLKLSEKPPSARCVPFFDTVVSWWQDQGNGGPGGEDPSQINNTRVLYDYIAGEAIVRVCTELSNSSVNASLGAENVYTPFAQDGCDLRGTSVNKRGVRMNTRQRIVDGDCITRNTDLSCADIINYPPCPAGCIYPPCCEGWGFGFDVQNRAGTNITNNTNGGQLIINAPECTMRLEKLDGLPECEFSWVGIYHTKSAHLEVFLWIVVAVPIIVNLVQIYFLWGFDPAPPYDDDWRVSFAQRGVSGSLYQFWWIYIAKRTQKFPEAKIKLPAWIACVCQDSIEGLASPIVAIHGCQLNRFPVPLALLSMKCIKIVIDAVMYFKDEGDQDEEGDAEAAKMASSGGDPTMVGGVASPGQPYQQMPMGGQQGYANAPPPQQVVSNTQGGTQYTSTTEV